MEKGCVPCNYSLVTVKGNHFTDFVLPANSAAVESAKSIIIFIVIGSITHWFKFVARIKRRSRGTV